jgi:iron(III) transport system ATP-binding protein
VTNGNSAAQRVTLNGLSRHFGTKAALDAVDLDVEPGSFTVLLGPSGSGKTTLLRCVAGIEFPTAGTVFLDGSVVAGPDTRVPPEKRGLSMVFQDYALWPHLDVVSNVAFALRRLSLPKADVRRRSGEMLERLGLGELAKRYPNELSGGEQQRVALARALVADMGLVLFDEPLSNLDADLREQLRLEIATLVREAGATALYITHDQKEAFALADQVVVLRGGKIVQIGSPEDIYHRPVDCFVARFTGVAGELPVVSVREAEGGRSAVVLLPDHLGGAEVPVGISGGSIPLCGGRIFVRPAGATIVPPSPEAHLVGEVCDIAFSGRGYEHALAVPGGPLLTGIFSARRFERGTAVGVNLDPEACLLLEDASGPFRPSRAGCADPVADIVEEASVLAAGAGFRQLEPMRAEKAGDRGSATAPARTGPGVREL